MSGSTEATLDCRTCGACCMDAADGRVSVAAADLVRWRRQGRRDVLSKLMEGHFGHQAFAADPEGRCVHLGTGDAPLDCAIYATRGQSCRAVMPGDRQCLEYRRRFLGGGVGRATSRGGQ